jgi:hypothetical protein
MADERDDELDDEVRLVMSRLLDDGVDGDFFDSGGDSLMAIVASEELTARTGIAVTARDIFLAPRLSQLVSLIRRRRKESRR